MNTAGNARKPPPRGGCRAGNPARSAGLVGQVCNLP